jgi:branched-chain amino acid transport system substrate-binding protein
MPAVYAKIRFLVPVLLCLVLSSCGGGRTAWNLPADTGIVTQDPTKMPDIAWQTPAARHELAAQDAAPVPAPVPTAPASKAVVALLLPLSGKNGEMGQAMLKAAQMALFDIGGKNVDLLPRDTKGTPEGAALAAREAVAGGASVILGPVFAEELRAVKPAASSVPVVAFTTDWTLAGGNAYVMGFLPFAQVARVSRYAASRGLVHTGVLAPQTPYGDAAVETLRRSGAQVTKISRYSPQQADLSAIVADFAAGSAAYDSVFLPVGGEGLRTIASLLDGAGMRSGKVRFLGTGLWDDASLNAAPAIYGGWYAAPDPRARAEFEKRYGENYGASPPRLASLAYDATALAAVLARTGGAGGFTRTTITNPRGFAGIDGIFRFRADGLAERGLAVLEVTGAGPKLVDPAPTAFSSGG